MPRFLAAPGMLSALSGIASAQTFGSITGAVTDPSGAIVPNAVVTVTNTQTNVARSTTTNTAGLYVFPDLVPGIYSVKVAATAFRTAVKGGIVIEVQQTARVDFALEFRTEMFNAPNHVELTAGGQLSWANGFSPAPSATFGRITSTLNAMREIQLALKFSF